MVKPVAFQARWTPENKPLHPVCASNIILRTCQIVKNILLYVPRWILATLSRKLFYPATLYDSKASCYAQSIFNSFWKPNQQATSACRPWAPYSAEVAKKILATYKPQEITLNTPDGCTLHGHYIQHQLSYKDDARVMLVFSGNGGIYQEGTAAPFIELLHDHETPYSFLVINPRGLLNNTGTLTPKGLIIDAESLYQYAQRLGYSEDRIDLYGHSMGGAMAAHLKALHPHTGGTTILDRTFAHLPTTAASCAQHIMRCPTSVVKWLAHTAGWNFDNTRAVQSIQDPVYIYNHDDDPAFPVHLGLAASLPTQGSVHSVTLSRLPHHDHSYNTLPLPKCIKLLHKTRYHHDAHMNPLTLCYKKGAPLFNNPADAEKNLAAFCWAHLLQNAFPKPIDTQSQTA